MLLSLEDEAARCRLSPSAWISFPALCWTLTICRAIINSIHWVCVEDISSLDSVSRRALQSVIISMGWLKMILSNLSKPNLKAANSRR